MRIRGLSMLRKTRSVNSGNSLASMGGKTIIGEQASFEGSIRGNGDLVINGSVKGRIEPQGYHLTVDLKGQVEADIHADKVIISGRLIGNIEAREKVEITKEADFNGEIKAKHISVEDGAYLKAVIELQREPHKEDAPPYKPAEREPSEPKKKPLIRVSDAKSLATSSHGSNVVQLFVDGLTQEAAVLDVGPICGENISFFAQRVKKLYVRDLFLRLDQGRRKGFPLSRFWQHLDYPSKSFDGILLWDLISRLDAREGRKLVELCHDMVRPGGMAMVFVLGEQAIRTPVNSFVIGEGFRLDLRPQPHLDLPFRICQNREVLALLAPFTLVKSFIYRSGIRQFLFQRD